MRVLALLVPVVASFDEDHMSVLQQKVTSDMLDRATRTSSFAAQLDAAVAGKKKSKCNEIEAAELVSCLRIGEVNALDLLTEGESLDSAVESITSRVGDADCETLRRDMRCMQENPCYKNAVKKLPITFDMDTMEDVKVSTLCEDAKSVEILEGSKITWDMVCAESPRALCSVLYDGVAEVKVDYDTCGVTCTGDIADELASTADDAKFATLGTFDWTSTPWEKRSRWSSDATCPDALAITNKADCEKASKDHKMGGKGGRKAASWLAGDASARGYYKFKFKAIRYQKRPAGCFAYKDKVYWNAVKTGKSKDYRIPVCRCVVDAEHTCEV